MNLLALPLSEQVQVLMNGVIAHVTGGSFDGGDEAYRALRSSLRQNPTLSPLLPQTVLTAANLSQFWSAMKRFAHYQERREFLWAEFAPLVDYIEMHLGSPAMVSVSAQLDKLSPEAVQAVWQKALDRVPSDPEGAITAARTLLETVCKHLLDDAGIAYADAEDLPKLWRMTAERLNLTPDQHEEKIFKTILGGCQAIIGGLGELRNRVGDAHGKGRRPIKPKSRHAELAVNLSGSMSAFLVATWLDQPQPIPSPAAEASDR